MLLGAALALLPGRAWCQCRGTPRPKYYMPDPAAARVVTIANAGPAALHIIVITQAVAEKEDEGGAKSCEIYAFNPSFFAVYENEPALISFRNYQADDDHNFLLLDPDSHPLMLLRLPALHETSYLFTFHREGLFNFHCTLHPPEMNGQILVLPARNQSATTAQNEKKN